MFDSLEPDSRDEVGVPSMLERLIETGLRRDDLRLQEVFRALEDADERAIDFDSFSTVIGPCRGLIERALAGRLTIPDFPSFKTEVTALYERSLARRDGELASYIPQLARVNPERFGVAICTADGQMFSIGDADIEFSLQSCAKPIIYSLALEEHGAEHVHRYIGREPSGRGFNELSLDSDGKPHNPMINSGAIMACALLQRGQELADRFEFVLDSIRRIAGGRKVGFSNSVYLSERRSADRNFALGYLMREHKAFPEGTQLIEILEFYLQCCSVEATAEVMAVVAATLANAGVCPTSGLRQFKPATVQNCLSLMSSCGMYDFSGEFAFTVGLPAKSGVSGAIIGVVPNVLGFCCWSPRLDEHGNSVRGLDFCRRLVQAYNFHAFDNLTGMSEKKDPRLTRAQNFADDAGQVTWAASFGDLKGIRQLVARGVDLERGNFDSRTALHLAAAEGHLEVVEYLLNLGVDPQPVDRFGNTPLDDATREGHEPVIELLTHGSKRGERAW
ncbi:Glutaminase [Enhygromyxa salina]|uniref:Glutaminase n=1 Tax=Enhygromyxa salina TaxID=215803 RepID=A0A2S9XWZ6_9BACT|nr:Glutaminase [Enhygromyxa salina]